MPPSNAQQLPDGAAPAAPPPVLAEGQIPHPVTGEPTTWDAIMAEYVKHKAAAADHKEAMERASKAAAALFDVVLDGWIKRQWKTGPQTPAGTPYLHTEWNPVKRQGEGKDLRMVDGELREFDVPADESDEAFKERVVRLLDLAELGDKAPRGINHQTLKGMFNSWREEGIEAPAPVLEVYAFEPKRDIRVRRPSIKRS